MAQSLFPGGTQNLMPPFERGLPQPFCTQAAWAVDSAVGNDNAPGTPGAPLRTLAELSRRWEGLSFSSAVQTVTVSLRGSFSTQSLALAPNFPGGGAVSYRGVMTELVPATAIGVYTPEASPIRASLTAGAVDFPALLVVNGSVRLRMVSGGAVGAVAWVQSSTGPGQANITQFVRYTVAGGSFATVNPAAGDQFVVEVPATSIRNFVLQPDGWATHTLEDVAVLAPAGSTSLSVLMGVGPVTLGGVRVFGTKFSQVAGANAVCSVRGLGTIAGCHFSPQAGSSANGQFLTFQACGWWTNFQFASGGYYLLNRAQFDGGGARQAGFGATNGAVVEYTAPVSIWDSLNSLTTTGLVLVEDGSQLVGSSNFYGANPLATNVGIVRNGCGWSTSVLPVATSAANPLVLAGAAAVPWAFAVAPAPGNAFLNARA